MQIECYASSEAQAQTAFRAAFDRIAQLDDALSDYKADSELSRITVTAVNRPVSVSPDLFRILAASQRLSEESGGAFDITLGPVTHLWRIARKTKRPPDSSSLQSALARCGYRKMHLDALAPHGPVRPIRHAARRRRHRQRLCCRRSLGRSCEDSVFVARSSLPAAILHSAMRLPAKLAGKWAWIHSIQRMRLLRKFFCWPMRPSPLPAIWNSTSMSTASAIPT